MGEYSWLLENKSDEDLNSSLQTFLKEKKEHEFELERIKAVTEDIFRELEMRRLAGSHADLQEFRSKLKLRRPSVVTGRWSSADPNISNAPKPARPPAQNFFLNESHELPRITKYQARKEREGHKYRKELNELLTTPVVGRDGAKRAKRIDWLRGELRKCAVAAKGKTEK